MIDRHRGESLNMVKVGDRKYQRLFCAIFRKTEYFRRIRRRINRQCGGDKNVQFIVFSTDLKHRWSSEKLRGKLCHDVIARNVFGLPNTDLTSRLVRGTPLIPRVVHENLLRKFSVRVLWS